MNSPRYLTVVFLLIIALAASAQIFRIERLVPKSVSKNESFIFAVSKTIGGSAQFAVTVTSRRPAHPFATDVGVMLFDGTNEIQWMSLDNQEQEKDKPCHYNFDVNTKYLAYSQFVFRYSNWTNHISRDETADSIFFFLRDF